LIRVFWEHIFKAQNGGFIKINKSAVKSD
jgi:ssDNA-specific exonuclease RecJ